nr:uncharacterized protein LOC111843759 [Paramormyrops kingsleyae]
MMFRLLLLLCLGLCLPAVLGVDSYISASIGESVTLPCDEPTAIDTKEALTWMCNGRHVSSFKNGSWCESHHYVNRTRLGSIQQNNVSLIINPVRKEDQGDYTCRINYNEIRSIRLNVKGGRKRKDAEMPPGDPACRPYREREDPPGSETKDKQDSDENPPGVSSGGNQLVIGVIVGVVVTVAAAVGAAILMQNRQRDENLPDPGSSEHPLNNGASCPLGDSSAERM